VAASRSRFHVGGGVVRSVRHHIGGCVTVIRAVAKVVAIGFTLAVLTATSIKPTCPPESGLVAGPMVFEATSDCGPTGEVVVTVDESVQCTVSVDGGSSVGLSRAAPAATPLRGNVPATASWLRPHRPAGACFWPSSDVRIPRRRGNAAAGPIRAEC
jgi:hypothetical protein